MRNKNVLYHREKERAVPSTECKKMTLRLEEETLLNFRDYCRARQVTAQAVLEAYVKTLVAE